MITTILQKVFTFIWKYKWPILATVFAIIMISMYQSNLNKTTEIERLVNNQETLYDSIHVFKTKDDKNAATIKRLELTNDEFKAHEKELQKTVKDLGIKLKNVQSITQIGTQTTVNTNTTAKDSVRTIIINNVVYRDTAKCFTYDTKWMHQEGCISKNNDVQIKTVITDSLDYVVYKIPKKFLFFEYGVKALEVKATSKNPDTKIMNGKFIDFNSIKKLK